MITLKDITLRRGSKLLFENASASVFAKQKVGVVGLNGCGKSSLFSLLLQKIYPDAGELYLQSELKIAYLAQEVPNTEDTALQYVMEGDKEPASFLAQIKIAQKKGDGDLVAKLHNQLYEINGYDLEARAAQLLIGLGFAIDQHQKSVNSFSGGWRMRLNLAQVLMSRADLLLLDEPTNYLDLDAIVWLEKWLQNYSGTLLLISHDRDFLDNVIERVIHVSDSALKEYSGNYSSFELQRAEFLEQEQALYKKQQTQITHLNKYIERFRYKASKARQAQSRIKALERMEKVSITKANSPFSFKFHQTELCSNPLMSITKADVGYGEHKILDNINFSLAPDEAIGVLGINGAGKSTFIKTLAGVLEPKAGKIFFNKGIKIGYFAQHQIDQLDMAASPIVQLLRIDPEVTELQARNFFGGFGFCGDMVFNSIQNFSGGEKARLVLALLIWQKPNLLLLYEPTNHLDLEMRESLTYALQEYNGALVLVAHDRYLLKATVDQFYLVSESKVTKFTGDLDDYREWLLDYRKGQLDYYKNKNGKDKVSKQRKVDAKTNLKEIKKIENKMQKLQQEKEELALKLSDGDLYQEDNRGLLKSCLKRSSEVEEDLQGLEDRWLELSIAVNYG